MFVKRLISLCLLSLMSFSTSAQDGVLEPTGENIDPLEIINRPLFDLNNAFDRYIFRPVAVGYHYVMPNAAERGVGNFFANLYDVNAALNAVLQGRMDGAAQSGSRFVVNSTLGLAGFFDVATPLGIRPYRTDFGHTLASWGVKSGPYVMVPFFGPRTFRSGLGTIVDTYGSLQYYIDNVALRNSMYGVELIHGRARLLRVDDLMTGDRYIFVRDAYLQQREFFVNEGKVKDDFSDFGSEDWGEEF